MISGKYSKTKTEDLDDAEAEAAARRKRASAVSGTSPVAYVVTVGSHFLATGFFFVEGLAVRGPGLFPAGRLSRARPL